MNNGEQGTLFEAPESKGMSPESQSAMAQRIAASFARPGAPKLPHEVAERGAYVNIDDRAAALGRALTSLAAATRRNGMIKASATAPARRREMDKRYGKGHVDGLIEGTAFNLNRDVESIDDDFAIAFGTKQLKAAEGADLPAVDREAKSYGLRFFNSYFGAANRRARDLDRTEVERAAAVIASRKSYRKPRIARAPKEELILHSYHNVIDDSSGEPELAVTELSPQEKLRLPLIDTRAGFIPKTYRENTAIRPLLDHWEEQHGIHDHLRETYLHQTKLAGKQKKDDRGKPLFDTAGEPVRYTYGEARHMADDAIRSRVHEYLDFWISARAQLANLKAADAFLRNSLNPAVSLAEEIEERGMDHLDLNALVQYAHLSQLRDKGSVTLPYDPLRTREDRSPDQPVSAKNKTVEDMYNAGQITDEVAEEIDMWLKTTTIGQTRRLSKSALVEEAKREQFWGAVYRGLEGRAKAIAEQALSEYISGKAS